jgi:hypothetical protein
MLLHIIVVMVIVIMIDLLLIIYLNHICAGCWVLGPPPLVVSPPPRQISSPNSITTIGDSENLVPPSPPAWPGPAWPGPARSGSDATAQPQYNSS